MKRDLERLVAQLTLAEKAALCTGANAWQTVAVERLGIPAITVSDGPHGVRRVVDLESNESLPATCFPTASALAASWDVELLQQLGHALAEECLALDVDILLGPGNNMKRSPLCGRNFEYFSEDPFLGGELAASYIQAMQSRGVGTSLKHYAANNQEFQRLVIDAQVDERALREIYLAGFERAVKQAQPWTVMCAYNRVNGDYCSEHARLLNSILKEEWGFEGFVVSDWGAVHDRVAALAGGLDLEMPGPHPERGQSVIAAVQAGELAEQVLDETVKRLLRVIFKAVETPKDAEGFNVEAHHQLARKIAGESLVLLKNEGGLLPLKAGQKLALIGNAAREAHFQGSGSSHIHPTRVASPFEEVATLAGEAELLFAPGYRMEPGRDQDLIDTAVSCAQEAEVALLYIALPSYIESEGYDRPNMRLTAQQEALIQAVAAVQPQTVVILNNGSAIEMLEWIDQVPAVLEAWFMGQAGGGAIADVLFGRVNPSGKLAETFPLRLADTPAYLTFPGENGMVRYGEGLFIGYRYYDARQQEVLFPFGHGLSYTTFAYSQLRVSAEKFSATEGLQVSVDVTNTGNVAGKEVVQLYVHDQESHLVRPEKELKGFAKVALAPGETKTVTLELDARAFAYYDPAYGQWVTESGAFDILVGRSATEICLQATVQLESTQELPCILTRESTIREWLADPRGERVLQPLLQQVIAQHSADTGALDAEFMRFAEDMPLKPVLDWFGKKLPGVPEQIIAELLAQLER
ncbi:MAG: glycoside hydrolase family 3 C-terminal domain-containing protein [Anaerolineae bacterium]|nr:glycoside hydrolase family 3 C-terminal domain-containing protein [Anaerolineae bacterium]